MNKINFVSGSYYRPLTGYEIEERKPLILKVGKNVLKFSLYSPLKTVAFYEEKERILSMLDSVKNNPKIAVSLVVSIADLLWNLQDQKPFWGFIKYRNFIKMSLYHSSEVIEAFYDLLHFQTHLFFLLRQVKLAPLFQVAEFSPIGGGLSQSAKARKEKHSSILSKFASTKKTKPNTNINLAKKAGKNGRLGRNKNNSQS